MIQKFKNGPLKAISHGLIAMCMGLLMLVLATSFVSVDSEAPLLVDNQISEIEPYVQFELGEEADFVLSDFSNSDQFEEIAIGHQLTSADSDDNQPRSRRIRRIRRIRRVIKVVWEIFQAKIDAPTMAPDRSWAG